MELLKYKKSKYKGVLITGIEVLDDDKGRAFVNLNNDSEVLVSIPLYLWYTDVVLWEADRILDDIRGFEDLEILD